MLSLKAALAVRHRICRCSLGHVACGLDPDSTLGGGSRSRFRVAASLSDRSDEDLASSS
jgi:hypothetical protein